MPIVNDEAFYLYDAYNIQNGLRPFIDFFGKAPTYVYALALWTMPFESQLLSGRFLTVLLSISSSILIFLILKRWHWRVALFSFFIFNLDGFVSSRSVQNMTNPFYVTLYLFSFYLYFIYKDVRSKRILVLLSLIITAGFLTRQIIIFIFPVIFFIEYFNTQSNNLIRRIIDAAKTPGILAALVATEILSIYVFFYNSVNEFQAKKIIGAPIIQLSQAQENSLSIIEKIVTKLHNISPVITEIPLRSPLMYIGIFTVLFTLTLRLTRKSQARRSAIIPLAIGLYIAATSYYIFRMKYINSLRDINMYILMAILTSMFYIFVQIYDRRKQLSQTVTQQYGHPLLFSLLGLFVMLSIYSLYSRFESLIEVYPFLVILAAIGLDMLFKSLQSIKKFIILAWILILFSNYYHIEYGEYIGIGSHYYPDFTRAVSIIQDESHESDTVFTGFTAFASEAHRDVPLHISHPSWYGYDHVIPAYRNNYLPPIETVENEVKVHKPKFVVIGRYTYDTYFKRYPGIREILHDYTLRERFKTFDLLILKQSENQPSYVLRTRY